MPIRSMPGRIADMMRIASSDTPRFPPTTLYNESWMLRLTLDCLVEHPGASAPLPVEAGAGWYSEGLLPSAFLPRFRGDPLGESYTRADGVIGHFSVGHKGKGDLFLRDGATQFTVVEGKMFSRLSKSVTNAPDFDQAARNVACIAETLHRANRAPGSLSHVGFFVVAHGVAAAPRHL